MKWYRPAALAAGTHARSRSHTNVGKCANCERGPSGIEGHERLFSHTFDSSQMRFKCRERNTIWVRRYGENDTYSWASPAGEHPGMDVPGRPGMAPP